MDLPGMGMYLLPSHHQKAKHGSYLSITLDHLFYGSRNRRPPVFLVIPLFSGRLAYARHPVGAGFALSVVEPENDRCTDQGVLYRVFASHWYTGCGRTGHASADQLPLYY